MPSHLAEESISGKAHRRRAHQQDGEQPHVALRMAGFGRSRRLKRLRS